jgi:hypothetical protein
MAGIPELHLDIRLLGSDAQPSSIKTGLPKAADL